MTDRERAEQLVKDWASENALYLSFDAPDYVGNILHLIQTVRRETWEEAAEMFRLLHDYPSEVRCRDKAKGGA